MKIYNLNRQRLLLVLTVFLFSFVASAQKTVTYDLYVKDTLVNFGGKLKRAIAVNGQIPMPTLRFVEGDSAVIRVHNQLQEMTSLHWHGMLVPNEQDGVPYLTSTPVAVGKTKTYNFKIRQNGTYWYHSHMHMQEQIGMYGAFIVDKKPDDPKRRPYDALPEYEVVLSEWSNTNPHEIDRMLHTANDYGAIKKNSVQSYAEAIQAKQFKTKFKNEWKRMLAMDVSDVYYESFLTNGAQQKSASELKGLKKGDQVRLRIANGGASTYFWLQYSGGKITVIASDGIDVEPVEVDRLLIAVSETYDIVVSIPEDRVAYELLSTAEDRSGSTSLWLGDGIKQLQAPLGTLKYFEGMKMMNDMMNMDGSMRDMGMKMSLQTMDMNAAMYPEMEAAGQHSAHRGEAASKSTPVTLNYNMLKATEVTTLPAAPTREMRFELTGNMNRYVWTLNNKTVSESDKILVKKGENLRITLYNNTMMRHPMHLHGHFFRLINQYGEASPLKNVMDIMPMETNIIEFNASEDGGDWYFHCHILYHMMSGMGRIFSYEDSPVNTQVPDRAFADKMVYKDDRMFHLQAENDFSTQGLEGSASYQNTRWNFSAQWDLGYNGKHGQQADIHIGRYFGSQQWLMPFIGFDWRERNLSNGSTKHNLLGQRSDWNSRAMFSAGVIYTLPWLVLAQTEIYTDGSVRVQLSREDIPISKRTRASFMLNTDKEYTVGLQYLIHKNMAITTSYDNDTGFGAGLSLRY
ncbi:multicopper oxidase family protein [Flavobacterium sp. JP2137]|uniref:multicopper oxidase family protein n=1 Tax=Flavobacterium sp. JP2137 TaxID=3414510 RepID=UPI003D2FA01D